MRSLNARAARCRRNQWSGSPKRPTSTTAGSRPGTRATNCCGPARWAQSSWLAGRGPGLGFDKPKGMFPDRSAQPARRCSRSSPSSFWPARVGPAQSIPYFIMTSDATHHETVDFFGEHNHFGLPAGDVFFFQQGNMPAVDAETRKTPRLQAIRP